MAKYTPIIFYYKDKKLEEYGIYVEEYSIYQNKEYTLSALVENYSFEIKNGKLINHNFHFKQIVSLCINEKGTIVEFIVKLEEIENLNNIPMSISYKIIEQENE